MKHVLFILLVLAFLFSVAGSQSFAAENPLNVANNKVGIHILEPRELTEAAKLVNSNGGDWGYVTIPIQAGDRNLEKWQAFFDEARAKHVIPLLRLATEGDYFNTKVWRKPNNADILDFANFLDSLNWPTKNKYIIVFNEVNRDDEWGGEVNPREYADLLAYTISLFKKRSPDYFIISSGMDNGAATSDTALDQYTYFSRMHEAVPGIFSRVDGFSSHSYPNPAFSQPPSVHTPKSISSFTFERAMLNQFAGKKLPIFITETGWSTKAVAEKKTGEYFTESFSTVWNDPDIVAITPFLLHPNGEQWGNFSFLNVNGSPNENYLALYALKKTKGVPKTTSILAAETPEQSLLPIERFLPQSEKQPIITYKTATSVLRWFLQVE